MMKEMEQILKDKIYREKMLTCYKLIQNELNYVVPCILARRYISSIMESYQLKR